MTQLSGERKSGTTRRAFVAAASCLRGLAQAGPLRIAIVGNEYNYLGDRFLVGYPFDGAWRRPNVQVVSLYVEQGSDLSKARAKEFGFQIYPSVAEALRCGGSKIAVDGVLAFEGLAGQCLEVFHEDGRATPMYADRSLAGSFQKSKTIVDAAKRLRFPLLSGSSLPLTWRLPDLELPLGSHVTEALVIGTDASLALEAMQSMIERRKGGETGVRAVRSIEGDAVWKADWPRDLLAAALSRSDTPQGLSVLDGRTQDLLWSGELQRLAVKPAAYLVEYRDGLRATTLVLNGAIADYNFAARVNREILSTQFLLTPVPNLSHSAPLARKIEQMFATGIAPYPAERMLLVSGILEAGVASGKRIETPHLNIAY